MGLHTGPKHVVLYVCSVIFLIVSLLLFIAGLAAPYWTSGDVEAENGVTYVVHRGLWLYCGGVHGDVECSNAVLDVPAWFHAVQGLQLVALIVWLGTTGYGAVANCWDPRPSHAVVLVVGTTLSCLVSFVSLMIYVGKVPDTVFTKVLMSVEVDYQWAFAIDLVGTLLGFFAAFGVAISYRGNLFTPRLTGDGATMASYTPGDNIYPPGDNVNVSEERQYSSSDVVYPSVEEIYPSGETVYTSGVGAYP